MRARVDLTGQTFGRLYVLQPARRAEQGGRRRTMWRCRCQCGRLVTVQTSELGHTRSCGCLKLDLFIQRVRTHGRSAPSAPRDPTYWAWASMLDRSRHRRGYYKRKIPVSDRWLRFEHFLADMGDCPPGLTLDRIDNRQGYRPGNCRWATRGEQMRNTGRTRWLTYKGERLCLQDWAARTGLRRVTIAGRLGMGWSLEKALTRPAGPQGRRRHR
jgi:hypothetical protein